MSRTPVRVAGVPDQLPDGERVLWQGAPDPRAVARHVFHQRDAAIYLALLIAWWAVRTWGSVPADEFVGQLLLPVLIAGVALALLEWLARMTARTSRYVITDRRVVLRIGIALTIAVNIPLRHVLSAGVRRFRDGTGQIALVLDPSARVAWLALWPHVRPWRWKNPEPLLRGLVAPEEVVAVLREAAMAVEGGGTAGGDARQEADGMRARIAAAGPALA